MSEKVVIKEEMSWEDFVRNEVNALLDIYLPNALNGNVGIRYKKPIVSQKPGGVDIEYDETKAEAVQISLVFKFDGTIDIPKEE